MTTSTREPVDDLITTIRILARRYTPHDTRQALARHLEELPRDQLTDLATTAIHRLATRQEQP